MRVWIKFLGCLLLAIILRPVNSFTEVPPYISFQGILKDSLDNPIDTTASITFSIFDDSLAGNIKWAETQPSVQTEDGLFTVFLGSVNPIPDSAFNSPNRWLRIQLGDTIIGHRTRIMSVAFAMRASSADEATPPDSSVSQVGLKTSWGEVSTNSYTPPVQLIVLPGGEFGFYPQVKAVSATNGRHMASILGTSGMDAFVPPTSYVTNICMRAEGTTLYARQRYVTSSGRDHWIFFLIDKFSKEVLASYQAPDHPSFGSGADETKIPHPFLSYDCQTQQVVLIDNCNLSEMKAKVTSGRTLLTVINEDYEIDFDSEPVYYPREIVEIDQYGDKQGNVIQRMKTPAWTMFLIDKDEIFLKRRIVDSLPPEICFKKLRPRTASINIPVMLSEVNSQ